MISFVDRSPQPEEKDDHEFVAVDCVLIEDDEEVETPSTSSDFRYTFEATITKVTVCL